MFRSPRARVFVCLLVALSAAIPMGAGMALTVAPTARAAEPTSVTIAGSLQQELGCSADWDPACATTHLTYDANDAVWQGTFTVPAGSWEYKAALNDSWTENYGAGGVFDGPNIALNLASATTVKFYYDHNSHWVTDNNGTRIITAPGSQQSELGCSGDWDPACLRSWLQDLDGDGTFTQTTTALTAGNYEVKAAVDESWDENYGAGGVASGPNILFNVAANNAPVTFRFVSSTNTLTVLTGAAQDNDIWWADLGHDSRDPLFRNPAGPVTTSTPVTLRLRAAAGDLTHARVRIWNDRTNAQSILNMTVAANDGTYEWWEATVPASAVPTIYWYRFIAQDGSATAFYEDDAARTGGWGETFGSSQDYSWQLTVYDPSFSTPDWVKNAVIYQVFPDRFRDGDSANNTPAGQFFYNETTTIVRSGTTEWNAPICDPRNAAGTCPGVYSQNFYGGDLAGLQDKLDYLEDLGVTAVYLNPIFESPSNHKYDTTDYGQVDDAFGAQTALTDLVTDMNGRGMHLILDGVFNHTSSDSIYFDRYGRHASVGACESQSSTYRDWYFFTDVAAGTGDCVSSTGVANGANYESWFGFDSLPKLNSANAEVRDLFYSGAVNPIGPYWLTWADGWRLDVGGDVDPGVTNNPSNDFWEGFRDAVRTADPDAYIVGEEWGNATPWTLGPEWDATMNYQFSSALLSFYRDETFVDNDHNTGSSAGVLAPITPEQFAERVLNLQERYPPEAFAALMNLLGSHDTNRPLFMLDHNADANNGTLYESSTYDWSDAIARLKGVVVLQASLPGAPTIYYGDEVGLVAPPTYDGSTWQDDPYNRVPYPWLDETGTPFYTHLQTAESQAALLDHYTTVFNARNDHPALRTGDLRFLEGAPADVLAYGRKLADNSDAAIVVVNRSGSAQSVSLDVSGYLAVGSGLTDLFGSGSIAVAGDGSVSFNIAADSYALYLLDAPMASTPAAVTDLTATGGSSQIQLTWTSTGGHSYHIYRSLLSGGGFDEFVATVPGAAPASVMNYTDIGLDNGTTYHYVIVSQDNTTLLESGHSNEASATAGHDLSDGGTSWFNLQWPTTITHTISTTDETDTIYAQIWINGATDADGATPGVRAQIGYGPDGTQPDSSWIWVEATYDSDQGNNDQFSTTLLPEETGTFDYVARWSGNGGLTWFLADLNGPQRDGTIDNPGNMTVNASSDTTAPSAPTLSLEGVDASQVDLSWTASSDGVGVAGYEIFRDGSLIDAVDHTVTTYSDDNVTTGEAYTYTVKAFDTSFNRSAASNGVEVTVENRMVDVTFTVAVPSFTPSDATIYVTGSASELGPWNPSANPMTKNLDGTWSRTFSIPDGTSLEWKYTRGSWETVEKWGTIAGLENRGPILIDYGADGTQTVDNTGSTGNDSDKAVQNWRDPLVAGHTPADDATDVAIETTVDVNWSKPMPSTASFSVTGPGGAIAGTFMRSNSDMTVTFTPDAPLDYSTTYDVLVSDQTDSEGEAQQIPVSFSFTTVAEPLVVLESITVTPANPTLEKGESLELTATGHYSDGSESDLTASVSWASSNTKVAAVDASGHVHAQRVGSAVITATLDEVTGQTTVTVAKKPKR